MEGMVEVVHALVELRVHGQVCSEFVAALCSGVGAALHGMAASCVMNTTTT